MTVIAFDGKYLAADKQISWSCTFGTVTKIFKLDDGSFVAFAGNGAKAMEVLEWFRGDRKREDYPKSKEDDPASAYQVVNGKMRLWDNGVWYELESKFFSTGSGQDFAHAAMHMGKNAIEAVQIAIECSHVCGQGIDWFDVTEGPI